MFKKLLRKVTHSIEQSKSEHVHRRNSSSNRGRREDAEYLRSDRREHSSRYSSSAKPRFKGSSSSDYRHGGERQGHKYYKNKYGSHSS
ncbi:hypothetical protein [Paenibacillus durus]|uniref:Uncharacterized protein n=1 Tax=Paenibacillus durus ATCC 35681 TaxID=1333534 RepID=A0A0F7FBY5_PAEDU|nr:hypothetical protein [Paenibacillus durus]AKG36267.1 hypothetical protein VK70_18290 [Paenibacillus durus ATCC 35681]